MPTPTTATPRPLDTALTGWSPTTAGRSTSRSPRCSPGGPTWSAPEVGAHSQAESFADGKLVVRTDSTAWATQLRLLAPTVVRRLNEDLGHGTVVVIEVLGPHAPSWKHGSRTVRDGRGPRDTYG